MISNDLFDQLHKLSRADKLRVIQMLVGDLAIEEEAYFRADATYDVWSPYDAPGAAQALLEMLDEDRGHDG